MSSQKLLIAAVYIEAGLVVQEVLGFLPPPTPSSREEARDKAEAPGKVRALGTGWRGKVAFH